MSININIKRLKNKYDCNLNAIIEHNGITIIYEGYELATNNEVIIESIPDIYYRNYKHILHPNIIQPITILQENNTYYLIYNNYKKYKNVMNIINPCEFNNLFKTLQTITTYLVTNKIEIEPIRLDDIYYYDDTYYFVIRNAKTSKNIMYGSPIYSPINTANKLESRLLWNIGILLYEIIKEPINNNKSYNTLKDITMHFTNINLEDSDTLLKIFLKDKVTFDEFKLIDPEKYNIVQQNRVKEKRGDSINDIFILDI